MKVKAILMSVLILFSVSVNAICSQHNLTGNWYLSVIYNNKSRILCNATINQQGIVLANCNIGPINGRFFVNRSCEVYGRFGSFYIVRGDAFMLNNTKRHVSGFGTNKATQNARVGSFSMAK